jgi:mRNA interferase RelE/StbE
VNYTLEFTNKARRQFDALDKYVQGKLRDYLNKHVDGSSNPRAVGEPLSGNLSGYWRYRIGNYRVVCEICDDIFVVTAVKLGHRSKIYIRQ